METCPAEVVFPSHLITPVPHVLSPRFKSLFLFDQVRGIQLSNTQEERNFPWI